MEAFTDKPQQEVYYLASTSKEQKINYVPR